MKHLLTALVALLSILPRGEVLGGGTACPRRYLRRINGKCYYFSVKKVRRRGWDRSCTIKQHSKLFLEKWKKRAKT